MSKREYVITFPSGVTDRESLQYTYVNELYWGPDDGSGYSWYNQPKPCGHKTYMTNVGRVEYIQHGSGSSFMKEMNVSVFPGRKAYDTFNFISNIYKMNV